MRAVLSAPYIGRWKTASTSVASPPAAPTNQLMGGYASSMTCIAASMLGCMQCMVYNCGNPGDLGPHSIGKKCESCSMRPPPLHRHPVPHPHVIVHLLQCGPTDASGMRTMTGAPGMSPEKSRAGFFLHRWPNARQAGPQSPTPPKQGVVWYKRRRTPTTHSGKESSIATDPLLRPSSEPYGKTTTHV